MVPVEVWPEIETNCRVVTSVALGWTWKTFILKRTSLVLEKGLAAVCSAEMSLSVPLKVTILSLVERSTLM